MKQVTMILMVVIAIAVVNVAYADNFYSKDGKVYRAEDTIVTQDPVEQIAVLFATETVPVPEPEYIKKANQVLTTPVVVQKKEEFNSSMLIALLGMLGLIIFCASKSKKSNPVEVLPARIENGVHVPAVIENSTADNIIRAVNPETKEVMEFELKKTTGNEVAMWLISVPFTFGISLFAWMVVATNRAANNRQLKEEAMVFQMTEKERELYMQQKMIERQERHQEEMMNRFADNLSNQIVIKQKAMDVASKNWQKMFGI